MKIAMRIKKVVKNSETCNMKRYKLKFIKNLKSIDRTSMLILSNRTEQNGKKKFLERK